MTDTPVASLAAITPSRTMKLLADNGTADGAVTPAVLFGLLQAADIPAGTAALLGAAPVAGVGSPPAGTLFPDATGVNWTIEAIRGTGAASATTATAFTLALSAASGTTGSPVTLTLTPSAGSWPAGVVVTPAATGLAGAFTPATLSPTGTGAVTCTFTPSGAATGSLNATASPTMTASSGAQTYTATAASGNTITFTGAAGAPTGNQVLVAAGAMYGGSGSLAGYALDGAGNATLPSSSNGNGLYSAFGSKPDGTFTVTYKNGAGTRDIHKIFRNTGSGATQQGYLAQYDAAAGLVQFYKYTGGAFVSALGNVTVPAITSTLAITINGGTFFVATDGIARGQVSDATPLPAGGSIGIGSGPNASPQTAISQVSYV